MTDTPARLIAAIARDLNHGCAVTDEVACKVKNLGELTAEFELAAQENDRTRPGFPTSVRWDWTGERLSHTTGGGRMEITALETAVMVTIRASLQGFTVVIFMFSFTQIPREPACRCELIYINPSLLTDRFDRVLLLTGKAFHEVHAMCERNARDENPSNDISTLAYALRECLLSEAEDRYNQARCYADLLLPKTPDQIRGLI